MTEQAISPLRRRMIEDMSIRKFAQKTQHDCVQRVKDLAAFLGRFPGMAEAEDVRRFRLHLTSSGAGTPKINATVAAFQRCIHHATAASVFTDTPARRSEERLPRTHNAIPTAQLTLAPDLSCGPSQPNPHSRARSTAQYVPLPRFRPLEVFGRQPPCRWKRS